MAELTLYSYWRSTAAYRVRVALAYKHIPYTLKHVHLVRDGGEQHKADYTAINPQALVPALVHDNVTITQSLAIMEYLDEVFPENPLLTGNAAQRARIRQISLAIATDIHPLNNLRVLQYLAAELVADDAGKNAWYHHWLRKGFDAVEQLVDDRADYCVGGTLTMADMCLIPQLYNAHRFHFDMSSYPNIQRIEAHCLELGCFKEAFPKDPEA
jgi:maleylpyruvate isomerase